jgi:hypothetical protein
MLCVDGHLIKWLTSYKEFLFHDAKQPNKIRLSFSPLFHLLNLALENA